MTKQDLCVRCKIEPAATSNRYCKPCKAAYMRQWRRRAKQAAQTHFMAAYDGKDGLSIEWFADAKTLETAFKRLMKDPYRRMLSIKTGIVPSQAELKRGENCFSCEGMRQLP
jgi:hypothetical protein